MTGLTSFSDPSQIDFFKCALLFQKIEQEKENHPNEPEKAHTASKIYSMKRSLQPGLLYIKLD